MVAGGSPVATWTVLFTDIVGSTTFRVRVGEAAFDAIRADLDRRVASSLDANGAAVVKATGDGVMVGFTATAAALRCAVAIQQAVEERNRTAVDALALRIGIGVGDAIAADGDLHGTAVVEAARLCAEAAGGTILCSEAVRTVSANRSGCTFGEGRPVELKGLPGPLVVHEVAWEPAPGDADARGLEFRVLGRMEVADVRGSVAIGGPKERLVLAVLLARANEAVSVDSLIDAVWADRPPRTAERTVHAYVARIRRALEPSRPKGSGHVVVVTIGRGYRLVVAPTQLDSARFETLARSGRERLHRGDTAGAAAELAAALAEWRGDAYGEFADVAACAAEAARLDELRVSALEDRVEADLAAGQGGELVGEVEGLLREYPFRERLWGCLITALYRAGRQRDALDTYQQARDMLVEELGIEPGPELRRLEAAVLAQDSSLDRVGPPSSGPTGLPLVLDAVGPAFLGREREAAWLRSAWATAVAGNGALVSVLGPEGIGKTRLVAEVAREAHVAGAVVLYARCDHAHRGARSLVELALRSGGGSAADLDAEDRAADLAAALARHLPVWARARPVLLVLDDLHLADAEALEFVADLAGWCHVATVLIVGVFRSDGRASVDGGGETSSQLVLGPLAEDAVGHVCQLYEPDGWSVQEVRRLTELTGGVPLLVHEQASAWARDRAARRVDDATNRLAVSRGRLVASRGEIADGVEGIQRLLEQRRIQLAGREARHQAALVAALAACPYKGLSRFERNDAANFFGRERLVAEFLARLAGARILAVVGPSGSGKSSLMRAGLLPAVDGGVLGGEPWRSVLVCPGREPTAALAAAIGELEAPVAGPRAVFVDQFEELFTLGASEEEQHRFVGRLVALCGEPRTSVVLAVRADHWGRCASHPDLAALLDGNDVLVGPMRDTELRRTIELPARRAGIQIEPGLVDVIVTDVAGRAGALPLLSTALAETWERRRDRSLTLLGYRAAGGVNGALARLAEGAYAAIPEHARESARRILLRLCDAGDDALELRRRLPVGEVVDEEDRDGRAALEVLADRRLLTVDGDAVEVAHEAVLREWPRLRTWLEEDVNGRRVHRRLGDAARAWDAAGRDPSELVRGTRLGAAVDWESTHPDALNRLEQAFLVASRAEAARELDEAERRAADRGRANRRLRRSLAGVAVALVLALVAAGFAVDREGVADRARERAEVQARDLALQGIVDRSELLRETKPDLSALLAIAAYELEPSVPALSALLGTFTAAPSLERTITPGGLATVDGVAFPDGRTFALVDAQFAVTLVDVETGRTLGTAPPIQPGPSNGRLGVSGDGRLLAVATYDGPSGNLLTLLDVPSLQRHVPDVRLSLPPGSVAVSADGALVAVGGGEAGATEIRRTADGSVLRTIPGLPRPEGAILRVNTAAATFLPDETLAITSQAGPLRIVDPESGEELRRLDGDIEASSAAVTLSPDGTSLYGWSLAGMTAWDIDGSVPRWTNPPGRCGPTAVAEAIGALVCGQPDGTITAFDLADGSRLDPTFDYRYGAPGVLGVTADGGALIAAGGPSIARWRLDGGGAASRLLRGGGVEEPLEYLASGALLVRRFEYATGQTVDLDLVDPDSGAVLDPLDDVLFASRSLRGRLAVQLIDGRGGEYDPARREIVVMPEEPLPFAPAGTAVAGDTLILWDDENIVGLDQQGRRTAPVGRAVEQINGLVVSAGGSRLFTLESSGLVSRRSTGEPTGQVLPGIRKAVATSDLVVVALGDGRLQVLDSDTLEPSGAEIPANAGPVELLRLSRDERRLLVAGLGFAVRIVDMATRTFLGGEIAPRMLPGRLPVGRSGVISDDGEQIAMSTPNGIVVWDLAPDALLAAACDVAGRNLTEQEWRDHIGSLAPRARLCPDLPAE